MPQLASGELGWAIDTQELYIGNGAVSEGAPAVGNTRILTESSNILGLVEGYKYKYNPEDDTALGIDQTLQEKLDEKVSVQSFGAVSNTSNNQKDVLQYAINTVPYGTVLYLQEGTYCIDSTLDIPADTTLIGKGRNKTKIKQRTDTPVISCSQKNIHLEGIGFEFSLQSNNSALNLDGCTYSHFSDIKVKGQNRTGTGITLGNDIHDTSCHSNYFEYCSVSQFQTALEINQSSDSNSFNRLKINECSKGFVVYSCANHITDSIFSDIAKQGIDCLESSTNNLSLKNQFYRVGTNDSQAEIDAKYSIIRFSKSGNQSQLDYFERTIPLLTSNNKNVSYIPEIEGPTNFVHSFEISKSIKGNNARLLRLPYAIGQTITLDYGIVARTFTREGTLKVVVGIDGQTQIFDDFDLTTTTTGTSVYKHAFTATPRTPDNGTIKTIDIGTTGDWPVDTDLKFNIHTKKFDV